MIVLSNNAAQTIQPGESVIFNTVILHSGCAECHRANSSSIKMKANGIYEVHFSANVANPAAAPVELSMQLGGETLPETTMIVTPAAIGDFNNVAKSTLVKNCCGDYDRVAITNTGATNVIIGANPIIFVKRLS